MTGNLISDVLLSVGLAVVFWLAVIAIIHELKD